MSGLTLSAEGIEVIAGSRHILSGASIEVGPGEMKAVTGASGAGKTTLLLVCARVLPPDAGVVRYLETGSASRGNTDRAGATNAAARLSDVGLVPQTLGLSPALTCLENVALPLQVAGVEREHVRQMANEALVAVGLDTATDRVVTELSGGQRQRVAVARALCTRPGILIADEATAELDAENQGVVLGLLARAAEHGTAVLLATHDPLVVERCSAAYAIEAGELVPIGTEG